MVTLMVPADTFRATGSWPLDVPTTRYPVSGLPPLLRGGPQATVVPPWAGPDAGLLDLTTGWPSQTSSSVSTAGLRALHPVAVHKLTSAGTPRKCGMTTVSDVSVWPEMAVEAEVK